MAVMTRISLNLSEDLSNSVANLAKTIVNLKLGSKLPEDTIEDLTEDNKGEFIGVTAYYRDRGTGKGSESRGQSKPRRLR